MLSELVRAQPAAAAPVPSAKPRAQASRLATYAHRVLPALLGFVLGSRYLRDSDVFWHLMLGRAVLRHGSRSVPEPTAALAWSEPCIAKDWLWDVACYALYRIGGFGLVGLLPSVFGAASAYLAARLVEARCDGPPRALHTCLVLLAVCASAEILDARPNLVLLTALPLVLWLAQRWAASDTHRGRTLSAAALVGVQLCWAQLHSSFVLGPLLLACVALEHPAVLRARRSELAATFGCMLLATTTSAYGLSIAQLILPHASGDAARHIQDMKPFDWSEFSLGWHTPLAVVALAALGGAGVIALGVPALSGVLLLALGIALTLNSARFVFVLGLLALAWACSGARALEQALGPRAFDRLQLTAAGVSALALALCFSRLDGPLLRYGPAPGQQPEAAARYLAGLPQGSSVFTEFTIGPPLGFALDGKLRTFVDGRTPMYFDDTDWAVARDMLSRAAALERGFARYGFAAAVVARESDACALLEARWTPVVIEPRFTTFVPPGREQAVPGLLPCGRNYLRADACELPASVWQAGLARQNALGGSAFLQLMAAGMQLQCGRGVPDLAAFPAPGAARAFLPTYRLYRARALFAARQPDAALDEIDAALDEDDALAALSLLSPDAGEARIDATRRVLSRALDVMDDNAPAALRTRMAFLCLAAKDAECARFQGVRAFLAGDASVRPVLAWVAQHHPRARVRSDLAAWLASQP